MTTETQNESGVRPSCSKKSQAICLICGDASDSAHFGVTSCRACAAFFRRWLKSRRNYVCGHDNKCEISTTLRFLCRRCRLDKCMQLGMKPLGENPRRKDPPSPPSREQSVEDDRQPSYIYFITNNYRKLRENRIAAEQQINMSYGRSGNGIVPSSMGQWSDSLRINMPLAVVFVKEAFTEFSELTLEEQAAAIQEFYTMLVGIELPFRSYRMCPSSKLKTMAMLTETSYVDVEDMDSFFVQPVDMRVKRELVSVSQNAMAPARLVQLRHMMAMKITDEEFSALVGLSFFSIDNDRCTSNMETIFKRGRTKIIDDLEVYYRCHGYDYFRRLGDLLYLQSMFLKNRNLLVEDTVLYSLVQLENHFIKDLDSQKVDILSILSPNLPSGNNFI